MKKAVIFDIDGVLAEKSPERDYREYDKVHLDKPNMVIFRLAQYYFYAERFEYVRIIYITGRKELCRDKTIEFLSKNWIQARKGFAEKVWLKLLRRPLKNLINNNLFMRADNDHRKAVVLKKEIYDNYIKGKYDVVACVDDDPEICEMYKNEGLFVLEVKR